MSILIGGAWTHAGCVLQRKKSLPQRRRNNISCLLKFFDGRSLFYPQLLSLKTCFCSLPLVPCVFFLHHCTKLSIRQRLLQRIPCLLSFWCKGHLEITDIVVNRRNLIHWLHWQIAWLQSLGSLKVVPRQMRGVSQQIAMRGCMGCQWNMWKSRFAKGCFFLLEIYPLLCGKGCSKHNIHLKWMQRRRV